MKAHPIASRFARAVTGAFNRADTEAAAAVESATLATNYPPMPGSTSPADAWQIMREHRANLVAALAAGLFVARIR